jgi:hypothetical protein
MNCDEAKILLPEYWGQSLGEAEDIAFEAHLAVCEACRAEAARLGELWKSLALVPVEEPGAQLRGRFYEALGAYRQGLEAARRSKWKEKALAWWPKQPAWQFAASVAALAIGIGVGYGMRGEKPREEVTQLREEVAGMRQLVALSLMQQQSASERLRGVSWAYRAEPSDKEVLSALVSAVNHDPNVNVRLAAVDALHAFAASPVTRQAVVQALPQQTTPIVQVALIDLLVDFKEQNAASELRKLAAEASVDGDVRQRAQWALERLQ